MARVDIGFAVIVVLGLALVWTTPPEPTYSVSVDEASEATPGEVRQFVDLETDAQREFLALFESDSSGGHEPPALTNGYVRYKGALYRVSVSVSESSVFSLLQPVVGGGLAALGGVGLVGRRVWRRLS
jgi:hypothetical protein